MVELFWKGALEVSGVGTTLPEGVLPEGVKVGSSVAVVFWKGALEVSGVGTRLPEGVKLVGGTRKAEHMFWVFSLETNPPISLFR